ncbi:hypothetical protein [Agromyces laixinhei]|uniref:hypothetical protein n=1 Tax=Agromyces laixinhei TaxID=2585717 RepID=UPI0012ECE570|nr:hypothetical protein [Agromyces laixinhei]
MTEKKRLVYLDTGVLLRRAEATASPMSARVGAIKPHLDELFADDSVELGCSDITLMEFHSNLSGDLRSTEYPQWDFAWYQAAQESVYRLVADGTIAVLPTPSHCLELAMTLISEATIAHQRALHSWDAAHAIVAAQWAYDRGQSVEIYSGDSDFEVLLMISSFGGRISVTNLDVLASTGLGRDRRNAVSRK